MPVLQAPDDALRIVAHWDIPHFEEYTRRTWFADRGVIARTDPRLTSVLEALLKEILALKLEQAAPSVVSLGGCSAQCD